MVGLMLPANASATTYCVSHPTCGGTDTTLQGALDAAAATPNTPDNVLIGSGTFPGPFKCATPNGHAGHHAARAQLREGEPWALRRWKGPAPRTVRFAVTR